MQRRLLPCLGLLALSGCVPPPPQFVYAQPAQVVYAQPRCDTSFTVVNRSSRTVERLFFSSSETGSWGNDQLGQNVLPPGRSSSYRAAMSGGYDFRVVWQNGRTEEIRNVDVCVASTITITNSGLRAS